MFPARPIRLKQPPIRQQRPVYIALFHHYYAQTVNWPEMVLSCNHPLPPHRMLPQSTLKNVKKKRAMPVYMIALDMCSVGRSALECNWSKAGWLFVRLGLSFRLVHTCWPYSVTRDCISW